MSHELHPTIEKFYLSILDYAGLKYEDGIIKNKDDKLGDFTIDGKYLTLPYFSNLKNPNGRLIFHPLNENYTNPENSVFNAYKRKLTFELNLKLTSLVINMINLSSEATLQQRIKSSQLIKMLSEMPEMDNSTIEHFLNIIKHSKKENDVSFLFDIFLKKNGKINDVPYAAIGKINFVIYKELQKALESSEYKVFKAKVRKKDILALIAIFNVIFPDIENEESYSDGTDNKVFRYLNALLKVSYLVSKPMNDLNEMLKELNEPSMMCEENTINLEWVDYLESLYDLTNEIRLIPNQVDIAVEAKQKLQVNESKVKTLEEPSNTKTYVPNEVKETQSPMPQLTPTGQVATQATNQRPLTPEEVVKAALNNPYPINPTMQPNFTQQANVPLMPFNQMPTMIPSWAQQEMMMQQMHQTPQQAFPQLQQPFNQYPRSIPIQYQPNPQSIPVSYNPFATNQMYPNQPLQQTGLQQGGLQLNPLFFN